MTETFSNGYRDAWCGLARSERVGEQLRVAGCEGLLQLVFHPDSAPTAHQAAHRLRSEEVISVAGTLVERSPETVNPEMPTGAVELAVSSFDLLADAETPPFQIDEDGKVGEELRLRHRYLDLRRADMAEAIRLRHEVVAAIRRHLEERGFLDIETPILTRSTPEGARSPRLRRRAAALRK